MAYVDLKAEDFDVLIEARKNESIVDVIERAVVARKESDVNHVGLKILDIFVRVERGASSQDVLKDYGFVLQKIVQEIYLRGAPPDPIIVKENCIDRFARQFARLIVHRPLDWALDKACRRYFEPLVFPVF